MKCAFIFGVLALGLAACNQTASPVLADIQLDAGKNNTIQLSLPITGHWKLENLPRWVIPTVQEGDGPINVTLSLERPPRQDTLSLKGTFSLTVSNEGSSTSRNVHLTAEMFSLTGRVVRSESVSGNDAKSDVAPLYSSESSLTGTDQTTGNIIVKYRNTEPILSAQSVAHSLGAQVLSKSGSLALIKGDSPQLLKKLSNNSRVEYAIPDAVLHAHGKAAIVPTDTYAPLQWHFPITGYGAVWRDMEESAAYTKQIFIGQLDTGVRFEHPDLAGKLMKAGEGALNLVSPANEDPTDPGSPEGTSHGTHVAGLMVAQWGEFDRPCETCSHSGVVGAAYKAPIKVLPIRVLDNKGDGGVFTISQGIRYAAGLPIEVTMDGQTRTVVNPHPVDVLNMSLGGPISAETARPLCEAVTEAIKKGVLLVASAGNDGNSTPNYPAACEGVIAVASVTLSGEKPVRAAYSNTYSQVTLAAPGGSNDQYFNGGILNNQSFPDAIFSTSWNYKDNLPSYQGMVGTSQAAPQVSVLAALLLSKGVATNAQQAYDRMIGTATDLGAVGRDPETGYGLINAAKALNVSPVDHGFRLIAERQSAEKIVNINLPIDELGRFNAYLRDGLFNLRATSTLSENEGDFQGRGGTVLKTFELGVNNPSYDAGELTVPR